MAINTDNITISNQAKGKDGQFDNLHLYAHCLKLGVNSIGYITTVVYTNTSTAFTFAKLCQWLNTNGFNDSGSSSENNNGRYWCSGCGASAYIQQISSANGSALRMYFGAFNQSVGTTTSPSWFRDIVVKIF